MNNVQRVSACLADRNLNYSTGEIAVCLACLSIRYGHLPEDAHCCNWHYCHCDPKLFVDPCASAECLACALVSECGDPLHYHHDGCPACSERETRKESSLLNHFYEPLTVPRPADWVSFIEEDDSSWKSGSGEEEFSDDHDIVSEDEDVVM